LGDLAFHAQGLKFRCIGLSDIGHRESLFQMGYKLRVDLDGKEPRATTASIQDSLGNGASTRPDLGNCIAMVAIDPSEHFAGKASGTWCNGSNGRRVRDKSSEKLDPISV
jgi:hypothetical protein